MKTNVTRALCLGAFFASVWLGLAPGLVAAPVNDNVSDAIEILTASVGEQVLPLAGSTIGATIERGENVYPSLAANTQRGTIWWKWTCRATGDVEFVAFSPTASVMAGAFAGSSLFNLTTVSEPISA